MKTILCSFAVAALVGTPSISMAGTFRVIDVWHTTADWSDSSFKVTTNARAQYFGPVDSNDLSGLIQTTVKSSQDGGAANSTGLNLTGPFLRDQVEVCEGSCGAWKVFRKLDCPINEAMDSINATKLFYSGAGKVAIYHQGSPEIHVLDSPETHQVPCNPRLVRKFGVWQDGHYPVPNPYRQSHLDLDLCYFKLTEATVQVIDPTGSQTTTTRYWDFVCP